MFESNNKFVLITRPEPAASRLAAKIEQRGMQAKIFSTLAFASHPDQSQLERQIQALADNDIAIFLSVNAVNFALPYIKKYYPNWPKTLRVAAVGPATQQALDAANIPVDLLPETFNSEGLLALSALQCHAKKTSIVLFQGENGRQLLAETLQQRGAKVSHAVSYQRCCPTQDPSLLHDWINQRLLQAIVTTSMDSLQNLLTLLGHTERKHLAEIPLLMISSRMHQEAQALGISSPVIIAKDASDNAILDALLTGLP